jgi:hypothetical protein
MMHQKSQDNLDSEQLIDALKSRFENNIIRHSEIRWEQVEERLISNSIALEVIKKMEDTGGEPDVVNFEKNKIIYCDCALESPKDRRSLCYDRNALNSRKENKPANSAMDLAEEIGIKLLTDEQYRKLQLSGEFDLKTSSWILTPEKIRALGGALFCDRRYDTVFTYHNGAESYYAARGFRGWIEL